MINCQRNSKCMLQPYDKAESGCKRKCPDALVDWWQRRPVGLGNTHALRGTAVRRRGSQLLQSQKR